MKQLKLKNSDLVVTLDDIDFEWSQHLEWVLDSSGPVLKVQQSEVVNGKKLSLIREIACRSLGHNFVDRDCKISTMSRNDLDLRRNNITVQKYYRLSNKVG